MKEPKISVIIPTYNREHTLQRAIKSVQNQTYKNWELIIVDDASTDKTQELVGKYINEKIKYFKNPTNKQKSYTRNRGVKYASGEYVAFLDSDDEWLPTKLEKQMESLGDKYIGCFTGANKIINGKVKRIRPHLGEKLFVKILKNSIHISIGSSCIMLKKIFDEMGGFREDMTINEDVEMVVRMTSRYSFTVIPGALINIYDVDAPRDPERILKAKIELLKYTSSIIETLKQKDQMTIYAKQYLSLARAYAANGNREKSLLYLKKSLGYRFVFSDRFMIIPHETYFAILLFWLRNL